MCKSCRSYEYVLDVATYVLTAALQKVNHSGFIGFMVWDLWGLGFRVIGFKVSGCVWGSGFIGFRDYRV